MMSMKLKEIGATALSLVAALQLQANATQSEESIRCMTRAFETQLYQYKIMDCAPEGDPLNNIVDGVYVTKKGVTDPSQRFLNNPEEGNAPMPDPEQRVLVDIITEQELVVYQKLYDLLGLLEQNSIEPIPSEQ